MKRFDQVNVIPFIDIMLVLLAIVLTTATFISRGVISLELPEAANSDTDFPQQPLRIVVDESGQYLIDEQQVSFDELAGQLGTLSANTPILLYVDRSVRFEKFVRVIDELRSNQLDQLSIVTENGS